MKLMSQIGAHEHHGPPLTTRLRRIGRRVRWGYIAWFVMFLVTASIALYAVRSMARMMNSLDAQ